MRDVNVCHRLESGQQELARIRVRTGVALILLGVALALSYEIVYYLVEVRSLILHPHLDPFWWSPWAYVYSTVAAALYHGRIVVVTLAPVARNLHIMRAAIAIDAVVVLASFWIFVSFLPINLMELQVHVLSGLAIDTCFAAYAIRILCGSNVARMRVQVWRLLGVWVALNTVLRIGFAVSLSRRNKKVSVIWMWAPVQLATLLIIARPSWQRRLRRALTSSLEARSSRQAAAGVAALVGNCRPRDVLAQASARFRCLNLDRLEFQDLADNSPSPGLFDRTSTCALRHCDAFVSHSWHDDPSAKWDALQRWRAGFVKVHGREPNVWIDKCCVDQRSIENDLPCLPVWLSGCMRLVVFCGPTFLSRLWCVLELFTFVHMGGRLDDITFFPVCRQGHVEEDLASIRASFAHFTVSHCDCFLPEDKKRMLDVIAEAFGDLENFNAVVRDIFNRSSESAPAPTAKPGDCPKLHGASFDSGGAASTSSEIDDVESGRRSLTPSSCTEALDNTEPGFPRPASS